MFHFINHGCIVQQSFGWNATHVQAYAAQCAVLLNQGNFQAFIGCGKGSRVAARATTQYDYVILGISRACKLCGLGRRCCGFGCFGSGGCFGCFGCACGFHHSNHAAF